MGSDAQKENRLSWPQKKIIFSGRQNQIFIPRIKKSSFRPVIASIWGRFMAGVESGVGTDIRYEDTGEFFFFADL